jgi:hypothetical protein
MPAALIRAGAAAVLEPVVQVVAPLVRDDGVVEIAVALGALDGAGDLEGHRTRRERRLERGAVGLAHRDASKSRWRSTDIG